MLSLLVGGRCYGGFGVHRRCKGPTETEQIQTITDLWGGNFSDVSITLSFYNLDRASMVIPNFAAISWSINHRNFGGNLNKLPKIIHYSLHDEVFFSSSLRHISDAVGRNMLLLCEYATTFRPCRCRSLSTRSLSFFHLKEAIALNNHQATQRREKY